MVISIPAPASALLLGRTSAYGVCTTALRGSTPLMSTSYTPFETVLSTPMPEVALACGSKSHRSTRRPCCFSAAVRFTQVVVLPTPPFWFTIATILAMEVLTLFLYLLS